MNSASDRPAPGDDPIPSDPAEIQAAIERKQAELADRVDELQVRLSPKDIARRASESAQQRANDAVRAPDGQLRVERIAAAAAAVVGLAGVAIVRRVRR